MVTSRQPKFNLLYPQGDAYVLPTREWTQLITRLSRVKRPFLSFSNVASVMLGVAGTTLSTAPLLPKEASTTMRTIYWAVGLSSLIIGCVIFRLGYLHHSTEVESVEHIIADMQNFAAQYPASAATSSLSQTQIQSQSSTKTTLSEQSVPPISHGPGA